jgi:hypothetical protein
LVRSPTHGFHLKQQPPEEVAAMLAEQEKGLGEEIEGLRQLGPLLLEWQAQPVSGRELEGLMGAYTQAARNGELLTCEQELGLR